MRYVETGGETGEEETERKRAGITRENQAEEAV
jgi:hypothetical protein